MKKGTVLITGASGGIGKALATHFAKDGHSLVLVARSAEKLTEVKQNLEARYEAQVILFVKDLSNPDHIQQLHDELQEQGIIIDYLVNNAGFGLFGEFIETDTEKELNMIDLNIRSLTHLSKLLLPGMVERRSGGILNVASSAAFQPGPLMAVYYATKAYVLSLSEALENEVRGMGVIVMALCPGPTDTGFSNRADLGKSKLFQSGVMDVETVAEIGYKQFKAGKTIVIPGFKNRLMANSVKFLPRKWVTAIVRKVQAKA
ncbi:SDR family NAD(P)-dependent oxidoreductase [Priestia koreensis]|uniref:SDR family NAD(P)-dependent oxidoreductase n=1 Tax=Priestia koreensis TaxID=284581 RepID=UPI00203F8980|nr:SDR family oxidoreductase [Priestia koreensis]MCM3005053.1 SDR family oxidoreductase [Priestia koreensis]